MIASSYQAGWSWFEKALAAVKAICRLLPDAAIKAKPDDEGTMLGAQGDAGNKHKRKETRECNHCGRKEHLKMHCLQLQNENASKPEGAVLMAQACKTQKDQVLLDSGATHHIDRQPEFLEIETVVVGDGNALQVETGYSL
jgi:hypothetical protein